MANKVTIDVEARFIDNVTGKANQASKAIDDLGKKKPKVTVDADAGKAEQTINETGKDLDALGKKKPKPTIDADDKAKKKVEGVLDRMKKLTDRVHNVSMNLKDSSILNGLSKIDSKINGILKNNVLTMKLKDGITHPLRTIKNQLFNIRNLVAAITAGFAIKKGVLDPINLADQYSSAKIGFSTLLGQEQGQKMMDDLDQFAKATPFTTSGVIAASQKMIAMGWDPNSIITDMKTIGDAAAATGKGTEGLDRITLALSQIKSKGKLSTEELNQLAEAGISAKRYIAEGLGYGSGDEGLAKMTKDLEKGAIGAEAGIAAIIEGMKEYDGMMQTTANETVEGLKSQLEDTFEINIARRWGQGLQDGAKKGLGSIVELLDSAEGSLEKVGDMLYDLGRTASNYVADVLEDTVGRIQEITDSADFKNADLMGKISMLWKGAIANPFSAWWSDTVVPWWDGTAMPWLARKAGEMGTTIGTGLTAGIVTLLGGDASGLVSMADDGVKIGKSFSEGFAAGFDGGAITEALKAAISKAWETLPEMWNSLPTWIKVALGAKGVAMAGSGLSTVLGGIGAASAGASKWIAGVNAGTGFTGLGQSAAIGLGAGNLAGGASLSAGGLAALGLTGIAGGAIGAGTLVSGGVDMYKGFKNDDNTKKTSGLIKGAGVANGAMLGALAGSVIPVLGTGIGALIGAGLGGIAGIFGSKKYEQSQLEKELATASDAELEQKASEGSEEAAKRAEERAIKRAKAIQKAYDKSFGSIKLGADEIQTVVATRLSHGTKEMEKFGTATEEAQAAVTSLNGITKSLNKMSWKANIQGKLSENDSQSYKETAESYMAGVQEYLEAKQYEFQTSANVVFGVKGRNETENKFIKDTNSMYERLNKKLSESTGTVNEKIEIALKDGVITADEEAIIQKAMTEINKIKNKIAKAQDQSKDQLIKLKFGGGKLDESSYNQMIEQILESTEGKQQTLDEAYEVQLTNLNLTYKEGSDDWNKAFEQIQESYNAEKREIELDASNLAFELAGERFENVLGEDASAKMQEALAKAVTQGIDPLEWTNEQAAALLGVDSLKTGMAGAIGQALSSLDASGFTVSDDALDAAAEQMVANIPPKCQKKLTDYLNTVQVDASGINATSSSMNTAASNIKDGVSSRIKNKVENGTYSYNINVTVNPKYTIKGGKPKVDGGSGGSGEDGGGFRGGIFYPKNRHVPRFANGGMVRGGAQLIKVAEEGSPEMIIPLSSQRRKRGLDLWSQAGHMMGVPGFANGGIIGGSEESSIRNQGGGEVAAAGGGGVQINVGGVTVEVSVNGGGGDANIAQAIAAQGNEIAETVAGILADAFNSQFENTPARGTA